MSKILQELFEKTELLIWGDPKTGVDKMHLCQEVMPKYITKDKIKNYFKFCIIRDPYEKLYSAWQYLRNRFPYKNINDFVKKELTTEFIYKHGREHFKPQYTFIYDHNLEKNVNFIIRYEYLNEDIHELNTKYGPKSKTPKLSKNITLYGNKYKHSKYTQYYNKESILKINKLYYKDFELLPYKKKLM